MNQSTKTKRVLIVEDDTNSQLVIQSLLEHYTFQVDVAENGKQALEFLDEHDFSAFIVDLSMPEMDGWELVDVLQRDPLTRDIPCIAITAFHSPEVMMKVKEAGFVAYFAKPIDVYTFEQELSGLLD